MVTDPETIPPAVFQKRAGGKNTKFGARFPGLIGQRPFRLGAILAFYHDLNGPSFHFEAVLVNGCFS